MVTYASEKWTHVPLRRREVYIGCYRYSSRGEAQVQQHDKVEGMRNHDEKTSDNSLSFHSRVRRARDWSNAGKE